MFVGRHFIRSVRYHRLHPAPPGEITFSQSTNEVICYDFLEITISVKKPTVENPFTGAIAFGRFRQVGQGADIAAEGFCDSSDGSVYRVRFML